MGDFVQAYLFRGRWELSASTQDVFGALANISDYPQWWPQFREVRAIDESHHWMVVRSFLPYHIAYMLTAEIVDPAQGVLEGRVEGDIDGRIRWNVDPGPRGSIVYFEESVETQIDLLNLLAPVARLAFEANHQLMMRDGRLGLRAYLAGRRPIRALDPARRRLRL